MRFHAGCPREVAGGVTVRLLSGGPPGAWMTLMAMMMSVFSCADLPPAATVICTSPVSVLLELPLWPKFPQVEGVGVAVGVAMDVGVGVAVVVGVEVGVGVGVGIPLVGRVGVGVEVGV